MDSSFKDKFCSQYMPVAGGISTLIFSTNIMNPKRFHSLLAPMDVTATNCLWFNAHLGAGLYIYTRKHLKAATTTQRVTFSIFGSVMFNFGTVLLWATMKTLAPNNEILRVLLGLASGTALLYVGREYLGYIDEKVKDTK